MRRRERNLWTDTPLAKLFTPRAEWHLLRTRALVQQLAQALRRNLSARRIDPYAVFDAALEAEPDFAALDLSAPAAFAPAVALFVPAWAAVDLSACLLPDDFGAPFVALADFEALAALLSWSVPLFEGASLRFSSLMWWRIPPVADSP